MNNTCRRWHPPNTTRISILQDEGRPELPSADGGWDWCRVLPACPLKNGQAPPTSTRDDRLLVSVSRTYRDSLTSRNPGKGNMADQVVDMQSRQSAMAPGHTEGAKAMPRTVRLQLPPHEKSRTRLSRGPITASTFLTTDPVRPGFREWPVCPSTPANIQR
jgi:hypothetical protein